MEATTQGPIRLLSKITRDKANLEAMPKIAHADGVWLVNTGGFPFYDPESQVRFEPGQPIKARVSSWIEQQPVIAEITDMDKPVEKAAQPAGKK